MQGHGVSGRKAQLLDAAIRYLTRHGVADLSLRPLGAAIGTSARLLVFHFGSRERLLRCVLDAVQARLQASFAAIASAPRDGRQGDGRQGPMRRFWAWATNRENLPRLRLLYEVQFLALQNPRVFARYLGNASSRWIGLIAPHLPGSLRNAATATLCAAAFDGLVIELLSTGDRRRTEQALDRFVALLAHAAGPRSPARRRLPGARGRG
jgi:AcrR family transcriptional regulator